MPPGSSFRTFSRPRPARQSGPVLAVGRRVLVTSPNGRSGRVTLTSRDGTTALATLATGSEVEIVAWHPGSSSATRYRVAPASGGTEGWLTAANLKPLPSAPVVHAAAAPARAGGGRRSAARPTTRATKSGKGRG